MKKSFLFLSGLALILLSACSKDDEPSQSTPSSGPQSFEEINTTADFNWSTQIEYILQIQGLKTLPFAKKELLEVRDSKGKLLARRLTEISQDVNFQFNAAAGAETFTITYGSIEKTVSVNNNTAVFDYIPVDDRSDLDQEDQ